MRGQGLGNGKVAGSGHGNYDKVSLFHNPSEVGGQVVNGSKTLAQDPGIANAPLVSHSRQRIGASVVQGDSVSSKRQVCCCRKSAVSGAENQHISHVATP